MKPETGGQAMTATDVKNPVEYVRGLAQEDKEAVFAFLIREAIRVNGGNQTLPETQIRAEVPIQTPEQRELTQHALSDLSKTFDVNDFLDELSDRDPG
jgi:hypothetical protein